MTRDAIVIHLETACEAVGLRKAALLRDSKATHEDSYRILWGNAESERHDSQRALVNQPVNVRVRCKRGGDVEAAEEAIDGFEAALFEELWGKPFVSGVQLNGIDTTKEQGDGFWECNLTVATNYLV